MQNSGKLKFILIGDQGIGKRSMLNIAYDKPARLSPLYLPIEFHEFAVKGKNRYYNVICYDSLINSTQVPTEQRSMVKQFSGTALDGADAVIFCYSADSLSSFNNLASWYKETSMYFAPNTSLYLAEINRTDRPSLIHETQSAEFLSKHKFHQYFKVNCERRESIVGMFSTVVDSVESLKEFNKSQSLVARSITSSNTFSSPDKGSGKKDIRYSDKKEQVVLMDGSYVKKMTINDQPGMDKSSRIEQKRLTDDSEPVNHEDF